MKFLIVYYSFTGNTRKVSQMLAEELSADIAELTCKTYTYGVMGGLRQAWDIFTGGLPPVEMPAKLDGDYDVIIAAGPVWAAQADPPLRSLMKRIDLKGRKLALFLTCDGTSEKYPGEKGLAGIVAAAPSPPIAEHLFKRAIVDSDTLREAVRVFAGEIRAAAS